MNTQWFVACAIMGVLCQSAPVMAQEAILPQGDPRLRDQPRIEQRGKAREQRLKQGNPNALSRHQTGIAHLTANSGQSSGMRVVRGEVKQATLKTIVVEDRNGKEATMSIDPATAGDRDIRPGDVITATVTAQGRAVTIHKEPVAEASHKEPAAER